MSGRATLVGAVVALGLGVLLVSVVVTGTSGGTLTVLAVAAQLVAMAVGGAVAALERVQSAAFSGRQRIAAAASGPTLVALLLALAGLGAALDAGPGSVLSGLAVLLASTAAAAAGALVVARGRRAG